MTLSLNQVLPGNKTDKTGIDVPPVASQEFTNVEGNAIEVLLRGLHTTGGFDFNDTNAFNSNGSPVNTEQLSKILQDIIRTSQTWNATNVVDNYILTPTNTNKLPYNTALNPGLNFTTSFIVPATNVSVNLTLTINGLHTQKKLYQPNGTLFGVGDIVANALATCIYDSTLDSGNGGYRVYIISPSVLLKATATDVNTGTNDTKFITPLALAGSLAGRLSNIVRITTSGPYTPAAGIKKILVLLIGGGGAGGPNVGTENGGGASGAETQVLFDVSNLTFPINVTIGNGAVPGGAIGGASSFGVYITCPGGSPGGQWFGGRNTILPTVSGGTVLYSTRGTPGEHSLNSGADGDGSGAGGRSILGGNGAGGCKGSAPAVSRTQSAEPNTGSGGGGISRLNYPGGNAGTGGSGICVIVEYV
jgi:hypothetical protein